MTFIKPKPPKAKFLRIFPAPSRYRHERRLWLYAVLGTVPVIAISGVLFWYSHKKQVTVYVPASRPTVQQTTDQDNTVTKLPDQTPNPAPDTAPDDTKLPAPTATTPAKTPAPTPPSYGVDTIQLVQAGHACTSYDIVTIYGANLGLINDKGGTIGYKLESEGFDTGWGDHVESVVVPAGKKNFLLTGLGETTPLLSLTLPMPHPSGRVRVHVMTPIDKASDWLEVPEQTGSSC